MFDSLTDKNLYEKLNKYSKIGRLTSCNTVEGIRGRDLDKFRLKNGQHNLHGDVINHVRKTPSFSYGEVQFVAENLFV